MESIVNKKLYEFSKTGEIIQTILIVLSALLVPTIVPQILNLIFGKASVIATHSQFVVGSIVNTALIISGTNVKGLKNIILISALPSLSALASGYIFGSLTMATIYMIPGIWLGNFAIIMLIKFLYVNKNINYVLSAFVSILVKVAIIFAVLNIWMAFSVLPSQGTVANTLRFSMGLTQLITATIGAIISFIIIKFAFKNTIK